MNSGNMSFFEMSQTGCCIEKNLPLYFLQSIRYYFNLGNQRLLDPGLFTQESLYWSSLIPEMK